MAQEISLPSGYGYATTNFTGNGYKKGATCTWGFRNPVSGASAEALAEAVEAAFTAAFTPALSIYPTSLKLSSITAKLGPVATGDYFVNATNVVMGTATTDPYSPNVAVLVSRRTLGGGKRARGRVYFPPPVEASIDPSGALASGAVTALQLAMDTLFSNLATAGWLPFLIHRWDPAGGGTAPVPTAIATHTVEAYVATLRGRLVRR